MIYVGKWTQVLNHALDLPELSHIAPSIERLVDIDRYGKSDFIGLMGISQETTWWPRLRSSETSPAPTVPNPPVTKIRILLPRNPESVDTEYAREGRAKSVANDFED